MGELDQDVVKRLLVHAPDQVSTHAESGMTRALYDCASVLLTPSGRERAFSGRDPCGNLLCAGGVERDGIVYELFLSTFPSPAFILKADGDLLFALDGRFIWPVHAPIHV